MRQVTESKDVYTPSAEIVTSSCQDFVPVQLLEFISWLVHEQSFHMGVMDTRVSHTTTTQCTAICHTIIGASRCILTPITLGLGIYIHHEYGSKRLLQDMHTLGYTVSYDEVRRFLTSAAVDQHDDQYVPRGLCGPGDDGIQVDAAIDNFDQNEETLDGKSTTHAMAAVIYKRGAISANDAPLPRVIQKSLGSDPSTHEDAIKRYCFMFFKQYVHVFIYIKSAYFL